MKTEIQHHQQPEQIPSRFFFKLTRIAVAQICASVGFGKAEAYALNALADIAARYLNELAKCSAASSRLSGRTDSNALDFVLALEDLCSVRGFPGASNFIGDLSPFSSPTVKGIADFVDYSIEIPFAMPLPPFCAETEIKRPTWKRGNGERPKHIPEWLPPFPETQSADEEECGTEKEERVERTPAYEKRGQKMEGKEKKELPAKRAKVRFKMGEGFGRIEGGCNKKKWQNVGGNSIG